MKTFISILTTASILLFSGATYADNCEHAAYFYKNKNFRKAQSILEPLVIKGEACAEFYMGLMYYYGKGIKRNNKNTMKGLVLIKSAESKKYPAAIKFMD